jgi:DNA-binding helix-hairpin-helix protein with protein kinase domain
MATERSAHIRLPPGFGVKRMMDGLLKRGQMLLARNMESAVVIEDMLGEGAQAEVYRARIGDSWFAVKWYRPEYLGVDARLWDRLKVAINAGSPTEQFLWPFDFVSLPGTATYGGYVMPIKPPEYISMADLLRRQCEPAFRALTMVGFNLANSFLKLHAEGLCYRDVNFGNVFFNPDTGDIRIADTDNVDVNLKVGSIKGTPGFMAPEVAKNLVQPNAMSDRFSLAVLLFYIFMLGHPLKGKRELTLPYDGSDPDKSRRLCEDDPVFVYHPQDDSNRPIPGEHDPLLSFWPIYPASLRKLFTRAFTEGLLDPDARVMENEWRKEMCAIRDAIFYCGHCTAENFYDLDRARQKKTMNPCWGCGKALETPPRMRLGGEHEPLFVALSRGARLFPHHLEFDPYNFNRILAEVTEDPPGLRNLSGSSWTGRVVDGSIFEVRGGEVLPLSGDFQVSFGRTEAQVRVR